MKGTYTMKAIVIRAPGEVEIAKFKKPIPKQGEALLRLLYGGICGSDLNAYRGTFAYFSYPRIPGHEFSAEIVEIGENDRGLKPGMVVTCNPYFNCGKCYSCRRGLFNCCMSNQTMGVQREGAFAEYITMPNSRIYDGGGLPAKILTLIEPFCISYHAVNRVDIRNREKVLVVGAGTIGVLAGIAAKAKGAEVYMADIESGKLNCASSFGFSGTVLNDSPGALKKAVADITNGDGFDVTVEAVGLPSTFQGCIDAAAFGGRVAVVGVGKKNLDFNFTDIQKKELNVMGSRNALQKDFLELINLVKTTDIGLERIITNSYLWTEAKEAFSKFNQNAGQMLKVLLDFTH